MSLPSRGIAPNDPVRKDGGELATLLRNFSTGGSEAHPLWDSIADVLAVPRIEDARWAPALPDRAYPAALRRTPPHKLDTHLTRLRTVHCRWISK